MPLYHKLNPATLTPTQVFALAGFLDKHSALNFADPFKFRLRGEILEERNGRNVAESPQGARSSPDSFHGHVPFRAATTEGKCHHMFIYSNLMYSYLAGAGNDGCDHENSVASDPPPSPPVTGSHSEPTPIPHCEPREKQGEPPSQIPGKYAHSTYIGYLREAEDATQADIVPDTSAPHSTIIPGDSPADAVNPKTPSGSAEMAVDVDEADVRAHSPSGSQPRDLSDANMDIEDEDKAEKEADPTIRRSGRKRIVRTLEDEPRTVSSGRKR